MLNPLALLGFLPKVLKTVGRITGNNIISQAAEALGPEALSPEKQAELQAALREHVEAMDKLYSERVAGANEVERAMIASDDRFTRRARPFAMYAATVLTSVMVLVVGIAMLLEIDIDWSAIASIAALIGPLWGHAVVYTNRRSEEKQKGLS